MDAVMSVVRPLRAAVDAALALVGELDAKAERFRDEYARFLDEYAEYPEASAYNDGRADSYDDAADRLRAALAPVADPTPHTTSDEETT
jgi:hypothetical protein